MTIFEMFGMAKKKNMNKRKYKLGNILSNI